MLMVEEEEERSPVVERKNNVTPAGDAVGLLREKSSDAFGDWRMNTEWKQPTQIKGRMRPYRCYFFVVVESCGFYIQRSTHYVLPWYIPVSCRPPRNG
mmetsp:Transcript_23284/g.23529  ORF Transcript_23284/g.23529 Transcript_23284/m.23529 type:complete len:98 (+) Transcript_23284:349-642(+)